MVLPFDCRKHFYWRTLLLCKNDKTLKVKILT